MSTGHGRRSRRTIKAVLAPAWIGFAGAPQAAQLRRTVTKKGKKTVEVVYLITSDRDADPATLAAWIRGHQEIENKLHRVRDVTYQEDKSPVRTGNRSPSTARAGPSSSKPTAPPPPGTRTRPRSCAATGHPPAPGNTPGPSPRPGTMNSLTVGAWGMRIVRWLGVVVWTGSWYLMYLEITRWRHVKPSLAFNAAPDPVTGIRPRPGLPLILLYVACVTAPLAVVASLVFGRRAGRRAGRGRRMSKPAA